MRSDIHHLFATDGYVNGKRSNLPYGNVDKAVSWTSDNNSKLGTTTADIKNADGSAYTGNVFEPIDEFKGDFARAQFYMATRYEDQIATWELTEQSILVLNATSDQVFHTWALELFKEWNELDPVSQKEIDRNNAASSYQRNRNPFVDHPEYVSEIWGN